MIAGCSLAFHAAAALAGANVYASYDANGVPRFTSEAYDAGDVLLLQAEELNERHLRPRRAISRRTEVAKERLEPIIFAAAQKYSLEPALLQAVIYTESNFDPQALSRKGAVGAMQLLPATAARYGATDLQDPAANVDAGARHLRNLLTRFNGNLALALAAYNAGEGAIPRHGQRIPPYRETMLYVPTVLTRYELYRQDEAQRTHVTPQGGSR